MFDGLDNAYPLTPMQQGLLYEVLRQPETDVYVAYIVIDIAGDLNEPLLKKAWEAAVQEHETLRTRFLWEGLDEPLQLVNSDIVLDWSVGSIDSTDEVAGYVATERATPLPLSEAPPTRFRLLRLRDDFSVLVWTVHHLLADDWSTPQVLQSVARYYGKSMPDCATVAGKLEFASYVDWLSQVDPVRHENYWRTALLNCQPAPLKLLAGRSNATAHLRHEHSLSHTDTHSVAAACQRYGITLSSFMHAAWALVIARYADTVAPLFGTSVSGRTCPLPAIENAVGLFLNTVPTQVHIDEAATVSGFLLSVQQQLFEQLEHEHLALSAIQKLAPKTAAGQLFDSVLVVESHGPDLTVNVPVDNAVQGSADESVNESGNALSFGNIRYVTDSNYPLTVLVFPGETLALHLISPPGQYADGITALVAQELAAVMADLASGQHEQIAGLVAAQSIRFNLLSPRVPLEYSVKHTRIHDWINSAAQQDPQATAIIDDDVHYSYAQLLEAAGQCTTAINQVSGTAEGNAPGFVGVYLERGFLQVAAVLGVLSSGHAYVPLDPQWPESRLSAMLEDAAVSVLVSESLSAETLVTRSQALVLMDQLPAAADAAPAVSGEKAYMIYTSGSSGKPKGVAISHANLLYSTAARLQYYPRSPARYLLLSSFAFDSSVAGIFWTLCAGGTLVLPGQDKERDIHELASLIGRHAVTHTLCLPSLYGLLLRYAPAQSLASLDTVIVAGEACPNPLVGLHRQTLPDCQLYNEYGPTEATVWSSVALLSECELPDDSPVPIGSAVPGSVVSVINQAGLECPVGVVGEILISGPGVAAGYHGDQVLTTSRFAQPGSYSSGDAGVMGTDGLLYFLGRADHQLKIRGHRIEPAEIELRVEQHALVEQAVCALVTLETPAGNVPEDSLDSVQRLVCYYTLSASAWQQAAKLDYAKSGLAAGILALDDPQLADCIRDINDQSQKKLQVELPPQFAVSRFVAINRMPYLPNGKIDHSGFPNLQTSQRVPVAQADGLCALLAQLLGLDSVSHTDNFFSLGGDSLAAIRFVATAREQGYLLSVPMLTRHATMGELLAALETESVSNMEQLPVSQQEPASGIAPLTPIQRWFFSSLQPQPAHWNMACQIQLQSPVPVEVLQLAIKQCLSTQPVLATQFGVAGETFSQLIPDQCPAPCIKVIASTSEDEAPLLSALLEQQSGFDLAKGELVRFVLLENQKQCCARFGFVAHHLVTDALSNWQLALRIADGCKDQPPDQARTQVQIHNRVEQTQSYREWALQLDAVVKQQTQVEKNTAVSTTCSQGRWRESDALEEYLLIDTALLKKLQQGCQKHSIALHECLLLGLLQSFTLPVCVDIETHGRDLLEPEVDVSTTLGWFSSFFSLPYHSREGSIQLADIARFRDLFRLRRQQSGFEFPQNPAGFFSAEQSGNEGDHPRLLYNYLAVGTSLRGDDGFDLKPLLDPGFRDGGSVRSHAIELLVTNDMDSGSSAGLRVTRRADKTEPLVDWQQHCLQALQAISVVFSGSDRQFSPEDFPDAGMDSDELNQFLDAFE